MGDNFRSRDGHMGVPLVPGLGERRDSDPPAKVGVSCRAAKEYDEVMVFRDFLSLWFLITSVLAPTLCCCSPLIPGQVAHAESLPVSPPPTSAAKAPCPHCKPKAATKDEAPKGKRNAPCPTNPGRDHCPCKERVAASTVPDPVDLRTTAVNNWLPDFSPFLSVTSCPRVLAQVGPRASDHRGPPPLAGIELLHRLHILIC